MTTETPTDGWLQRTVARAIQRPKRVFAAWGVAGLVLLGGMAQLRIDTSTSTFLNRTGDAWQAYQSSLDQFGGDEVLVVAVVGDEPFDSKALGEVRRLSEAFASVPGVRRVDSLSTVPLIRESVDRDVRLDPALSEGIPATDDARRTLIRAIRDDHLAPGGLVSHDERVFAINLLLDRDVDADREQTVSIVRELLQGTNAWVSGVPVFRTAVNSTTRSEVFVFVPMTLGLIALILVLSFGSFPGVFIPLLVGWAGMAGALGAMGAVGVTLSLATLLLPTVLLALGCAYSMHVVTAARGCFDRGQLEECLRPMIRPVALSGLTTAIGFLAMATVGITAIRELATYGAVGVLVITSAALTLAPAALSVWPVGNRTARLDVLIRHRLRRRLVSMLVAHSGRFVAVWAVLLVVFGFGLSRLTVSTDIIRWFPASSEIRSDYERIRASLSGITPVNVVVRSDGGRSVLQPGVLAAVGELRRSLQDLPQVGKAISLADALHQMRRVFVGSDAGLPEGQAEIEQYVLLMSSVDYLNDVLSSDRSATNVLLRVDDNSSDEIVALSDWVRSWWDGNGVPGFSAVTTGIMYEFARAEEEIAYGEIRGLGLALAAIAVILLLLLRSVGAASLALLPNAVPIAIAFGFMGLAGLPLDAATVCVGSLGLGIAVDNTIHVVTAYGDNLRVGRKPAEAIDQCLARVLPALVLTTLAIASGFAVLAFSEFTLIRSLGLVTSGLVFVCLLADTTLLPSLLLTRDRFRNA